MYFENGELSDHGKIIAEETRQNYHNNLSKLYGQPVLIFTGHFHEIKLGQDNNFEKIYIYKANIDENVTIDNSRIPDIIITESRARKIRFKNLKFISKFEIDTTHAAELSIIDCPNFYFNQINPNPEPLTIEISVTFCKIEHIYISKTKNQKYKIKANYYRCEIDHLHICKNTIEAINLCICYINDLEIENCNIQSDLKIEESEIFKFTTNSNLLNTSSFNNTLFFKIPDIRSAIITKPPILDGFFIPNDVSNDDEPETAPSRFRALRRMAVQSHDHLLEQYFLAGEIKAYRKTGDNWRTARWWFGWAYQITSDFGLSIMRPLLWIGALFELSFIIHIFPRIFGFQKYQCTVHSEHDPSATASALMIALKNSFLSLGSNAQKIDQFYECLHGKNPSAGFLAWDMFHMVISGALIWSFIKALMLHFKAK